MVESDESKRKRPVRARRRGRATGRGRGRPAVHRERRAAAEHGSLDASLTFPSSVAWPRPPPAPAPTAPARPLRILMIGWEFPPSHTGGLGVHCYELCKEITRLGHTVTFTSPFPGPFTAVAGVRFRHPTEPRPADTLPPAYWSGTSADSPFLGGIDAYNAWIGQLTERPTPDVVHVHDWFGTVGAAALARRLDRPLVMTVHSTEYDRSLGHPWAHILEREQSGIDAATRVIAVSQHLRQQLIQRYRADPRRVRVIYNAVRPTDRLSAIDPKARVVLYVGRLAVMKGVDTFLRAAARVLTVIPDALFVIAGEGPEYGRLIELAARLGIGERVMFLGKVTDEEREILLGGSSVFVLPSVVEPFGIAALEAMAAGVPTIVSKTSGVAEISNGTFRVDFWDVEEFASRIAELLEYPTLRRAMGEQGRWEALREGWPERARETVQLYAEAIAAGSRRA
ncbi:MAG TPA: glycosyltransferase family 4 protein [Thermoplasmata archaeon]|nr:glycosyltransferase family 4 protein [Thermoplasmata archaeon]